VQLEVWSLSLVGYFMCSPSMLGAIEAITELTGRQKMLPPWTQLGAVVGLEGGTKNVTKIVDSLFEAGVPMAGR
jgi:sulfoquinovosidase